MRVCMSSHEYMYVYICHMYVYMQANIKANVARQQNRITASIHCTRTHAHTHIYIYVYIHMYVRICTDICTLKALWALSIAAAPRTASLWGEDGDHPPQLWPGRPRSASPTRHLMSHHEDTPHICMHMVIDIYTSVSFCICVYIYIL